MKPHINLKSSSRGSILVVTMLALTVLTLLLGSLLVEMLPRHNLTYQTAAWQESRMAAEAGIEYAVNTINKQPAEAISNNSEWAKEWASTSDSGSNVSTLQYANATLNNGISAGSALRSSPDCLYLDNMILPIASTAGRNAVVDVEVRALFPDPARPDEVWFRIRSLGTAGIQGFRKWTSPFAADARLRSLGLNQFPFPNGDSGPDFGVAQTSVVGLPNASRIIEVIARPLRAFSVAILTDGVMNLGNSNNYLIDSYNSKDGPYTTDTSKENGDIASNGKNIDDNEYEILADKSTIKGDVNTHDVGIDGEPRFQTSRPDRITGTIQSGFEVDLPLPTAPSISILPPADLTTISPGSYTVIGDLGAFTVPTAGKVVLKVTGDWVTGSGAKSTVILAEGASVEIYVAGTIDFGNGDINVLPTGEIGAPGNLKVYGTGTSGEITMSGNPNVSAAIYAPSYDVIYKGGGNGAYYGAVVANTWDMSGGGNSGFHYDESLADSGLILGYRIASYFEDWRRLLPPKKS